jgi:hypothetical protein
MMYIAKPTNRTRRAISTVQLRLAMTDKELTEFTRMVEGRDNNPSTLIALRLLVQKANNQSSNPADRERLLQWWADYLFGRLDSAKAGEK